MAEPQSLNMADKVSAILNAIFGGKNKQEAAPAPEAKSEPPKETREQIHRRVYDEGIKNMTPEAREAWYKANGKEYRPNMHLAEGLKTSDGGYHKWFGDNPTLYTDKTNAQKDAAKATGEENVASLQIQKPKELGSRSGDKDSTESVKVSGDGGQVQATQRTPHKRDTSKSGLAHRTVTSKDFPEQISDTHATDALTKNDAYSQAKEAAFSEKVRVNPNPPQLDDPRTPRRPVIDEADAFIAEHGDSVRDRNRIDLSPLAALVDTWNSGRSFSGMKSNFAGAYKPPVSEDDMFTKLMALRNASQAEKTRANLDRDRLQMDKAVNFKYKPIDRVLAAMTSTIGLDAKNKANVQLGLMKILSDLQSTEFKADADWELQQEKGTHLDAERADKIAMHNDDIKARIAIAETQARRDKKESSLINYDKELSTFIGMMTGISKNYTGKDADIFLGDDEKRQKAIAEEICMRVLSGHDGSPPSSLIDQKGLLEARIDTMVAMQMTWNKKTRRFDRTSTEFPNGLPSATKAIEAINAELGGQ